VWRAQIILATADRCGTAEIIRRSGKAKPVVWTWQARFMAEGVDGLLRDKTRKPGKPPLPADTVQLVVDLVTGPPPGEATHWTGQMLAKAAGVSLRSVQRILEAHQLARTASGRSSCRTTQSSLRSSGTWSASMSTLCRRGSLAKNICSTARNFLTPLSGGIGVQNPLEVRPDAFEAGRWGCAASSS